MGGSVSSGRDNDELVDNLIEGSHIKTEIVEHLFRAVDRGIFYTQSHKESAYRDLAWRDGNLHISAPCIYCEVMEALELKEGLSFLNIGSGTGYLSTMIGLKLGPYGVNHNIEIHGDVIEHARKCVVEFVKTSPYFDGFNFCAPKFINGNFLNIEINDDSVLYDRIYIGTGVTNEHVEFAKSLLNLNGIMVVPLDDYLVQIKRVSEKDFVKKSLMSVSFASLISDNIKLNSVQLPKRNPMTLQEICRYNIRNSMRDSIQSKDPNYFKPKKRERKPSDGNETSASSSSERPTCGRFRQFFLTRNSITERQFRILIHGRLYERLHVDDDDEDEYNGEDENEDRTVENITNNNNNNNDDSTNSDHIANSNDNSNSDNNDKQDQIQEEIDEEMMQQEQNETLKNNNQTNQEDNSDIKETKEENKQENIQKEEENKEMNTNSDSISIDDDSNKLEKTQSIPIPQSIPINFKRNDSVEQNGSMAESGFCESEKSSLSYNHNHHSTDASSSSLSQICSSLLSETNNPTNDNNSNQNNNNDHNEKLSHRISESTNTEYGSINSIDSCFMDISQPPAIGNNETKVNPKDTEPTEIGEKVEERTEPMSQDDDQVNNNESDNEENSVSTKVESKIEEKQPVKPPRLLYERIIEFNIPDSLKRFLLYNREY